MKSFVSYYIQGRYWGSCKLNSSVSFRATNNEAYTGKGHIEYKHLNEIIFSLTNGTRMYENPEYEYCILTEIITPMVVFNPSSTPHTIYYSEFDETNNLANSFTMENVIAKKLSNTEIIYDLNCNTQINKKPQYKYL